MATLAQLQLLTVILTGRCNLRCRYCYQDAGQARSMTWETLRTSLDLVVRSCQPVVQVLFTGGEPLLEFANLGRAVAYLQERYGQQRRFVFGLNTNGTLLTEDIAAFLARHRFQVQLSFDGVESAQDVRGPGTFAALDRLLDDLRRSLPGFYRSGLAVAITTTPATIGHLAASARYFLAKDVSTVAINPCFTDDPGWQPARIAEIEAQFGRMFEDSLGHLAATGEVPLLVFRRAPQRARPVDRERTMCGMTSEGALAVDVDGRGYGCSAFASNVRDAAAPVLRERKVQLDLGRIDDPGFPGRYACFGEAVGRTELFHHKERKHSSYGRCADCACLPECSLCPASILQIPGNADPHRVADFCCAYQQVASRYRARFPACPREFKPVAAPR